ncbi:MAG: hypothetical protein L0H64_13045 [Pseudonocardia sp.]|nr:hypothetical protein [Pseudonocardia sp.]
MAERTTTQRTTTLRNRARHLRRRPQGSPTGLDLRLVDEPVPDLLPGQALVRATHRDLEYRPVRMING